MLSQKAVQNLDLQQCIRYYNQRWKLSKVSGSDVVLACCLADYDAKRAHVKGFTAGPPGFHECQCTKDRYSRAQVNFPTAATASGGGGGEGGYPGRSLYI